MKSLAAFFGLTFLVSWALWLAVAWLAPTSSLNLTVLSLLFLPGTFAPAIVAIVLTERAEGRMATRALLSRMFKSQVPLRWYVFAMGYLAAVDLVAAIVNRLVAGQWPTFSTIPIYLMLAGVVFSTPFQAGEEIGWRGYALPRLAAIVGLAAGSVILGVIWALWHLPLFFISGTDTAGQPFFFYLLSVTALSVAMAWLYRNTGGSLLLVMLMHSAINNTKDIVPSAAADRAIGAAAGPSLISLITIGLLWIGALYFLYTLRNSRTVTEAEA